MGTNPPAAPVWFAINAGTPEQTRVLEAAAQALVAEPEHEWLLRDLVHVVERQGLYAAHFRRRAVELTVCYDPADRSAWGESVSREGTGLPLAAPEYLVHSGAAILQRLLDCAAAGPTAGGLPTTPLTFPDLRLDPSVSARFITAMRGESAPPAPTTGAPVRGGAPSANRPTRAAPPEQPSPTTKAEAVEPPPDGTPDEADWRSRVLSLDDALRAQVFGQDEAIIAVRRALLIHAAGLSAPNRPIGGFMFLGPTGVGKTELANSLTRSLFDDPAAMLRLDMSEYMESHTLARLVGAPPGYVGFNEGGQLTEFVKKRPRCVVLLDEFDKAHPDVPNILLQVLDAGRLTDGRGNTVDFSQVLLIMTSNLHAELFREIDLNDPEAVSLVREAIVERTRRSYRPEFIARLDGLLVFNPLTRDVLEKIGEKHLRQIQERTRKAGHELTWDRDVVDYLVDQAAADEGARAITKATRQVLEPLALRILERAEPGGTYRLSVSNGSVRVQERRPTRKRPAKSRR